MRTSRPPTTPGTWPAPSPPPSPALIRSRPALLTSLLVVVGSLALMPATQAPAAWLGLRFVAGVASAVIFVIAASVLFAGLRAHAAHLVGWGFGGIGAGIALSGGLVLALRQTGTWEQGWWGAAVRPHPGVRDAGLGAADAGVPGAGRRRRGGDPGPLAVVPRAGDGLHARRDRLHRRGTFLVAAIEQSAQGWAGTGAWVLVGLAALPAAAMWAALSRICCRATLLIVALAVQSVGVALPVPVGGAAAALLSAVIFGATFLGVATLSLSVGGHLRVPGAVAILTVATAPGRCSGHWSSPRYCTTGTTRRCS